KRLVGQRSNGSERMARRHKVGELGHGEQRLLGDNCTTHRTPSRYLSAVSQIEGGKASAGAGENQQAARKRPRLEIRTRKPGGKWLPGDQRRTKKKARLCRAFRTMC